MAEFQEAMTLFAMNTKHSIRDVGLKNAALMCRESMMLTPPMAKGGKGGLTVAGEKAGKRAIAADVRKLYVAADTRKGIAPLLVISERLAYSTKYGNPAEFRSLLKGAARTALQMGTQVLQAIANDYDDERAFKKAKNYFNRHMVRLSDYRTLGFQKNLKPFHDFMKRKTGGRFKKGGKPMTPLANWRDKELVQYDAEIMEYISQRTAAVGMVKSGWYKVLLTLPKPSYREGKTNFGTSGIANYIKMHAGTAGYHTMSETPSNIDLVIGNAIADTNNVSTEAGVKETVLGLRYKQIYLDLSNRLQKDVANFNQKIKT